MLHRALADAVLVLHFAFVLFVVGGGLLALRWRWAPLGHVPAAAWGVYVELAGRVCPLTPLENALRRASGAEGYTGSFVEHYLGAIIYPSALTAPVQLALACAVVTVNAVVYAFVFRSRRARRGG